MIYAPQFTKLYYFTDALEEIESHELENMRYGDVIIGDMGMGDIGFVQHCVRCEKRYVAKRHNEIKASAYQQICSQCREEVAGSGSKNHEQREVSSV